jgi:hypothetical protein
VALTLIEAIAGRAAADGIAREIDLAQWDARHDSAAFRFTRPFALTAIRNTVLFWKHEELGIELTPGIDEVSLVLAADAWSRTARSHAVTFSRTDSAVRTLNGLDVVPDRLAESWPRHRRLPAIDARKPARVLDEALHRIGWRYGKHTEDFVAMQLEYPR